MPHGDAVRMDVRYMGVTCILGPSLNAVANPGLPSPDGVKQVRGVSTATGLRMSVPHQSPDRTLDDDTRVGQPDHASPELARIRPHLPLVLVLAACATVVVAADPPQRMDLLIAEWFGSAVALGMVPLLLVRGLRIRKVAPVAVLTLAMAVALAQGRHDAPTAEGARPSPDVHGKRLPTASDGFGAYTTPRAAAHNS